MISGTLTKRYTRALFDLACEQGASEAVAKDLATLAGAYEGSAELRAALASPSVAADDKRKVIQALLERIRAHVLSRNFAMVLLDRGRTNLLPSVATSFRALQDRAAGRVRAEVVSARELGLADRHRLKTTLTKSLGAKEVQLDVRVDPALIAGVVTRVGNVVLDGSLEHRLASMREFLSSRP